MRYGSSHAQSAMAIAVSAVLTFTAGACSVGPNYQRPEVAVPAHFGSAPATQPATQPTAPLSRWWTQFDDPVLNALIDRALSANLDLRVAEARTREARASYAVTSAGRYPSVNFGAGDTYTRASASAFNFNSLSRATNVTPSNGANAGGSNTGGLPPGNPLANLASFGSDINLFQAGFDASWELDIFGGVRRGVEAASADYQASIEDQRDVWVSLIAEVARNYIELRGFQKQLQIARQNLEAQKDVVQLTKELLNTRGTSLDVARAEALYASIDASIPTLEHQVRRSILHLSILAGREPLALESELAPRQEMPYRTPDVPLGLPSELLRRRPDIRRAERQLAAATARIGVATAELFPRFSLTGSFGTQSDEFSKLANWSSRYYAIGPTMRWPIFDAGRIRANIGVQNARTDAALAIYQKAVLTSLEDVENAVSSYGKEQARRKALVAAVDANQQAMQLAELKYKGQVTDFLEVLDARRSLFAAQDELAVSERNVAAGLVALYKALGGGWESVEAPAKPAAPSR